MYVCTELCLSWPGYCARRFLLKFSIIACDLLAQNVPGNCNLLCGHLGTYTLAHTLAHRQACLLPYIFIWLTLSIIAGITRGPNKLVARLKCKTNKQQTYRCCRHKETPVYECVCASVSMYVWVWAWVCVTELAFSFAHHINTHSMPAASFPCSTHSSYAPSNSSPKFRLLFAWTFSCRTPKISAMQPKIITC